MRDAPVGRATLFKPHRGKPVPSLVDTSIWARKGESEIASWLQMHLAMDQVGITDLIALELLQSARGANDFKLLARRLAALPHAPIGEAEWRRAYEILGALVAKGRSASPTSSVIAAAAEAKGWTLVHSDADFDLIAEVTGQDMKRL